MNLSKILEPIETSDSSTRALSCTFFVYSIISPSGDMPISDLKEGLLNEFMRAAKSSHSALIEGPRSPTNILRNSALNNEQSKTTQQATRERTAAPDHEQHLPEHQQARVRQWVERPSSKARKRKARSRERRAGLEPENRRQPETTRTHNEQTNTPVA